MAAYGPALALAAVLPWPVGAALLPYTSPVLGDVLVSDTGMGYNAAVEECRSNGNRDLAPASTQVLFDAVKAALQAQGQQNRHIIVGLRFQSGADYKQGNNWKYCDGTAG
eukprot:Hpha_TRINITY_DN20455_c0_g1::TRINITY_DN20455_c0_g1_i1::g.64136::m.64136